MKSEIILNERVYAEKCLESGKITGKPFNTLSILARYYYHIHGYRKTRIYNLLIKFMEDNYQLYLCNKADWDNTIERIANSAGKYELFEIDGIRITKSEMNTIDSIKSHSLRRVLFTLLCLAKLGMAKNHNSNGWVNHEAKEVFSLARVNCRASERYQFYNKLNQMGLLEFSKRNDNLSVRVTYIDDDSDDLLLVSDFRELGYEYLNFHGGNFTRCKKCGILIRDNKYHNKKYCNDCSRYHKQDVKTITCVDCGMNFNVDSMNNTTTRCPECYNEYRKNRKLEMQKERRLKSRLKSAHFEEKF